jgi:hypothetical protein
MICEGDPRVVMPKTGRPIYSCLLFAHLSVAVVGRDDSDGVT